jgi:hypothetical protein
MGAIISLLFVLAVSLLFVRIATVALMLTGLSRPLARFQARSAFTGVGFTTSESERVVGHPVRRRIIMLLMLLGNAGIVTTMSALIVGFVSTADGSGGSPWWRIVLLVGGLVALWMVAYSSWVDRRLSTLIAYALKRYTSIEIRDYANLLHLGGDYGVSELGVTDDDWLAGRTLGQLKLSDEGVAVLGIQREDGEYLGAPRGDALIRDGDLLILYGRAERLRELDQRKSGVGGQIQHVEAVAEQKVLAADEAKLDEEMSERERKHSDF